MLTLPIRLLFVLLLSACKPSDQHTPTYDHPWPTAFHDSQRTNATTLIAPAKPALKWRLQLAQGVKQRFNTRYVVSIPVVASGNIVYVVADCTVLKRIDPDGTVEWSKKVQRSLPRHCLSLQQDGQLLIAGDALTRVTSAGQVSQLSGRDVNFGPIISGEDEFNSVITLDTGELITFRRRVMEGALVGGSADASEIALMKPSQRETWMHRFSGATTAQIAWQAGNTFYTDTDDGLVLLDSLGNPRARQKDTRYNWTPVVSKSSVCAASRDLKQVHWYDTTTLAPQASANLTPWRVENRALAADGTLFVSAQEDGRPGTRIGGDGYVAAYDSGGRKLWSTTFSAGGRPCLALAGDTLLAVLEDDTVRALNARSGKELWSLRIPGCMAYPVVGEDQMVFVIDRRGGLNAIGEK
jgi:outer membrane protein assembly factor BamB